MAFNVQANDSDSLEQLSKTLRQGSYSNPDEIDLPAVSSVPAKLRDKTIELSDEEIEEKFRAIAKRYVNSNFINVRNKPNGTIVDKLKRGQSVFIYDVSGYWERISKENESPKWVDSNSLCSTNDCYKPIKSNISNKLSSYTPRSTVYTPKKQVSSVGGCSCGPGNFCYGPRGGRYCYTSGGNKSYR
ncbi:MAG: hypothetical protein I8H98_10165 [Moraxellaceae bacterium]|nr:hypothetical protein [Moraxellaceae bacterium]